MKTNNNLKHCPTCGSTKIHRVKKNWVGEYKGEKYVVEALEYDECPACGERVFDKNAAQRIQEKSPAFRQHRHKKAA